MRWFNRVKVRVTRLSSHAEKCHLSSPELQRVLKRNSEVPRLHNVLKIKHEATALDL